MSYRVAVIQNENELLRYSYADVRQSLSQRGYQWSYYTAENVGDLAETLSRYDAVIIATNACSDFRIADWLKNHRQLLKTHLERTSAGLLVCFQMALSDRRASGAPYPFLWEPYEISGKKRFEDGELAAHGDLFAGPTFHKSTIAALPHAIDLKALGRECRENSNVPGLYWGFLTGFSENSYETLVLDATRSPHRPLLVAGRPGGPRIVHSSIVVDWQGHRKLWENLVRYVVEGDKPVAVVAKKSQRSFDLELIEHALANNRIPQHAIELDDLAAWSYGAEHFAGLILDPAWSRDDLQRLLYQFESAHLVAPDIHYFDRVRGSVIASSSIPAASEYSAIVQSAVAWLRAEWRDQLWEGSFWATFDVLDLFRTVGTELEPYRGPILDAVSSHIQPNGSYDDVFGATCAALQIFHWLEAPDDRIQSARAWLQGQLPRQNLYNAASFLEALARCEPAAVDRNFKDQLVQRVLSTADRWPVGLETIRYMRTLVAVGEHARAAEYVSRLRPATVGTDEWLTVFGAAETLKILLDLCGALGRVPKEVDQLLFGGLAYLLDKRDADTGTWRRNAVATAKAANALWHFDRLAKPAVGSVILAVTATRANLMTSAALTHLQERNAELSGLWKTACESLDAEKTGRAGDSARRRSTENAVIALFLVSYCLLLVLLIAGAERLGLLPRVWEQMVAEKRISLPVIAAVVLAPVYVVVRMLDAFCRTPSWVEFSRKHIPFGRWVFKRDG